MSSSELIYGHIRSNAVGYAAVFLAMSGSAIAFSNSQVTVHNRNIASGAVDSRTLRNGDVQRTDLAAGAVNGRIVADRSLGGRDIRDGALGGRQINEPSLDFNVLQSRVTGACTGANAIQQVAADGTVACQPTGTGTITGVSGASGSGLTGGGTSGAVALGTDPSVLQSRVTGTCTANNAVQSVDQNGGVNCSPFVTGVTAGTGLTGGTITNSGTIAADTSVLQSRVSGSCAGDTAIQSIDSSGSANCSSAFAPATQVLTSGKVDAGTFPSVPLLQYGGITVGTACEAFAGEADVSISVSSGTISFAGHSSITGDFGAANFPNSAGAVLGRATTAGATTFTALTSAGKTLNGEVLMLHNGSGSCSYEASGLTGG